MRQNNYIRINANLKLGDTQIMDAFEKAAKCGIGPELLRKIQNWVFERGLMALHYDPASDWWHCSDGECYTTTVILRGRL
jgi:hypothetical protein